MKYKISLRSLRKKTVEIEAKTPHEALKQALEDNREYKLEGSIIEDINGKEGQWFVLNSFCFKCKIPILNGDKYWVGQQGDYREVCVKCGPLVKGDILLKA